MSCFSLYPSILFFFFFWLPSNANEYREWGVENVNFISILASAQGITKVAQESPSTKFIVGAIDPELDNRSFISPGIGDVGDRLYGTA